MAQLDQAHFGTQQQRLREQPSQRCQVPLAKLGQRGVIRMLIACQIAEGDVFIGTGLDLARAVDAVAYPCSNTLPLRIFRATGPPPVFLVTVEASVSG